MKIPIFTIIVSVSFLFELKNLKFTKHDLDIHFLYVHVVYTGVSPNQEADKQLEQLI